MSNKLTDEQIIRALECCCDIIGNRCSECPKYSQNKENDFCQEDLHRDAIDLINRQKADIEKLKRIERFATKTIEKQNAEIERLKEEKTQLNKSLRFAIEDGLKLKHEAIKEFWQRLKSQNTMDRRIISVESGDNLLKEMAGD